MYSLWTRISDYIAELITGPGNGVVRINSTGPGSLEFRLAALGNSSAKPYWRVLLNATGGVEIQQAEQSDYSDAKNVLSLDGGDVNVVVDNFGLNLDSQRTDKMSRVSFRNSDGTQTLGQIVCGPSPLNSAQPALTLSAINASGTLQPYMLIDPRDSTQSDSGDNPICVWASGGWHRLRRSANGNATLS